MPCGKTLFEESTGSGRAVELILPLEERNIPAGGKEWGQKEQKYGQAHH